MNIDLIQTITRNAPGVLSGITTFSQLSPETADSVQSFNSELSAWRQRAEAWQSTVAYLADVEWLMEHNADEVADMAHQLKADKFELVRTLINLHRQRAGLLEVMTADLQAAESDATKKLESAKSKAKKDLGKILKNDTPREKTQFNMAIQQAESVTAAAGKLREVRGHLSALAEMKRPLAANEKKLCELLTEAAHDLIK